MNCLLLVCITVFVRFDEAALDGVVVVQALGPGRLARGNTLLGNTLQVDAFSVDLLRGYRGQGAKARALLLL